MENIESARNRQYSASIIAAVDCFRIADTASAFSAILAAGAMYFFNWLWADAVAGLLVAMLISISAVSLMRSAWQMLR